MNNASPDVSGGDRQPVFREIPGMQNIKTWILVFTLVATMIPALTRGWGIVAETIRDCDYVARYGGEAFIVLLTEIEPQTSMVAAERIRRRSAQETILSGDASINVMVSIGAAFSPGDGDTPRKLIQEADRAPYDAGKAGRNKIIKAADRKRAAPRSKTIRLGEKS